MENKIVIVTGGSQGIGYTIAEKYLKHSNKVVITSRKEDVGKVAEAELSKLGDVMWVQCDVAKAEDCKRLVDVTCEKYGQVDILVNCAAVEGKGGAFADIDFDDTLRTIQINVMGTVQMTKYASDVMRKKGQGVVINIGSICGIIANHENTAYHASKGAIRMITQSIARELTPYGIRVLSVAPAWVATQMVQKVLATDPGVEAFGKSLHMSGEIIKPEQIAGAVYILSSEEASAINGTTVMVDDGYSSFKGAVGTV